MEKAGVIYILTNPSFPEYVKIGYADDVNRRLKELNRSECIPFAFRLFAYYEVSNRLSDKKIHEMIDRLNPNLRSIDEFEGKKRIREFYAMDAEEAYSLLEAIAEINGLKDNLHRVALTTKEIKEDEKAESVRAESFRFSMCNLKEGDVVEYIFDSNIKCTIKSDKKITYNEEEYTLTGLAKVLLGKYSGIAGPHYFTHKGEKLCDLRERIQSKGGTTNEKKF